MEVVQKLCTCFLPLRWAAFWQNSGFRKDSGQSRFRSTCRLQTSYAHMATMEQ